MEYRGKFDGGNCKLFGFKHAGIKLGAPVLAASIILVACNGFATKSEITELDLPSFETTLADEYGLQNEPTTFEFIEDSSITMLARLADSVARGRSDEVKKIVMWVAINRVEDRSHGYGGSLKEEINRPKQWQQFDPTATYLESTYRLADEVYKTWQNGGPRPIYNDMLWFVLNGDGSITVRNQFKATKNRAEATFGQ